MEIQSPPVPHRRLYHTFSTNGINVLCELQKMEQLCDGVIKVENREFLVHRALLSAYSPYFCSLFSSVWCSDNSSHVVVIHGVSADTMETIVEHAYTQLPNVTTENVQELLIAADQFLIHGLKKVCCNFLSSQMCQGNCIGILKFAKAYNCILLEKTTKSFLMQNFLCVVYSSSEFLELDIDDLCDILKSDELDVKNEEKVFWSVLKWIDHDPDERKVFMPKLLRVIRLGLLTPEYFIDNIKTHPYVKENNGCIPIIMKTLRYLNSSESKKSCDFYYDSTLRRPRIPFDLLFVFGGWGSSGPTNSIETYNSRTDSWIMSFSLDILRHYGLRAYHGVATIDKLVYIIGGMNGLECFNGVCKFDPASQIWEEVAPMHSKRCYVSVAVVDNRIYAMGGHDGIFRLNSAEEYCPKKNQWSVIHPMHVQRSNASATALEGKIYICGGISDEEVSSSMECYDPETKQWTMLKSMRNRRSGLGVMAYHGCVYAVGGYNGIVMQNSGEKYCPKTKAWNPIPQMDYPRSNFAIEVIDDTLFVMGGFDGVRTMGFVECYDNSTDEWHHACDMNVEQSALSACVISGLSNRQHYLHRY